MITFITAIAILVIGYFVYGKIAERVFKPDANRKTPAITMADGVDYMPLPAWKVFMIQFLNIDGLGPIFGAIMGAKFGAASYLWIVLGSIFGGAVHDYFSGMLSVREKGESLPEIIGRYLGLTTKQIMRWFMILLLMLVGAVFVAGPAGLLEKLTPDTFDATFWIIVVFAYYLLAMFLPIDKVIGKLYPLFAGVMLFMATAIFGYIVWTQPELPEITAGLQNQHPTLDIFPFMFISIACGAISGFHATQSPMMARCMTNEKLGRPIFYGSMITEGIVTLIWAAAATVFFHENGMEESNASVIVNSITTSWFGPVGAVLALLGVIAAPISTGDTALRSARLMVSDMLKIDQKSIKNRLILTLPIFAITIIMLVYSLQDKEGFEIIWRYFAWSNQTLAAFTLWAITVYLVRKKSFFYITLIPAIFMTSICTTYLLVAKETFGLPVSLSYTISAATAAISIVLFILWYNKDKRVNKPLYN